MRYVNFGKTDMKVSELCLGTMTWGNQNTEADAHEQLAYAVEQGINFIDTAEIYPIPPSSELQGKTERFIGNWLAKEGKRDDLVIATKVAGPNPFMATRPGPIVLNRENIMAAIDGSLERLQTDYVDLYQVHWPQRRTNFFGTRGFTGPVEEGEVSIEETLTALGEVVKAGKVRYVGVSNETPWGVAEYVRLAKGHDLPAIVSIQNQYSLLNRTFEVGLSELCLREGITLLPYSVLSMGVLSGKYLDGQTPAGARFTLSERNSVRYNGEHVQPAVKAYVEIAKRHGLDPVQMSIAFALRQHFVDSVIIGASSLEQLKTDIAATEVELSPEVLEDIAQVYATMPDVHA